MIAMTEWPTHGLPEPAQARQFIERQIIEVRRMGQAEGIDVTARIDDLLERWLSIEELLTFVEVVE